MNKITTLISAALVTGLSFNLATAQELKLCSTSEMMAKYFEEHPSLKAQYLAEQQQEEQFCKEKKEILNASSLSKRVYVTNLMKKYKDDHVVMEVGNKMIRRIDMSLEEELTDLNRRKEEKLERARMRLIAENEDELKDL